MNNQMFKADAEKLRPSLLIEGVPNALKMVTAVLTYGAQKYEAHSWKNVESERYKDAKLRHILDMATGEAKDEESDLLHEAHELCNGLFILELKLLAISKRQRQRLLRFNSPPIGHKSIA